MGDEGHPNGRAARRAVGYGGNFPPEGGSGHREGMLRRALRPHARHAMPVVAVACAPLLGLFAFPACGERQAQVSPQAAPSTSVSAAVASSASAAPQASTSAIVAEASPSASASAAAAAPKEAPPRLATTRLIGWIYERPHRESTHLGYIRVGQRIVRGEAVKPAPGESCAKWWSVVPVGYMCEGNDGVTTDVDNPTVAAAAQFPPRLDQPLPYGYGTSYGTSFYVRAPTKEQQEDVEGDVLAHQKQLAAQYAKLDPKKVPPASALPLVPLPDFLEGGKLAPRTVDWPLGPSSITAGYAWSNMRLSFLAAFEVEGRPFYFTSEHFLVPADRVRAARLADFHGVQLAKPGEPGEHLPMVWVRWRPAKVYSIDPATPGDLQETTWVLPFQAHSSIAKKERVLQGTRYFELDLSAVTPESMTGAKTGLTYLVRASDVSRIDAPAEAPKFLDTPNQRWLEVRIAHQSLVLYEGVTPVFITLVSTGVDGVDDPETSRATPRGVFRIFSKHYTYRMAADEHAPWKEGDKPDPKYRVDDVPWVQYFHGGYALHAAYWHDAFGNPKSHGCINLSPRDAQWLFGQTEPKIPDGWYGVYMGKGVAQLGTWLVVRAG